MRTMLMLAVATSLAACGTAEPGSVPAGASSPAHPTPAAGSPSADTTPGGWKTVLRGTDGFDFVLHRTPADVVDSVFVVRGGRRVQTLVPARLAEPAVLRDPTYRVDLDFDGHLDFALATLVPAGPNVAFDYWRYDPAAGRFRYVGEYQMLEPNFATRTLGAHTRDGHAGRAWTNERWRWENGALVEFWRSSQSPTDSGRYIYRESERRGGQWVVVKADTLENCDAEPIDEECEAIVKEREAAGSPATPRDSAGPRADRL